MVTQVSFTADEDLKNRALKKAKQEGITLKTVLIYSLKSFVDGKMIFGIFPVQEESEVEEIAFDDQSLNEKAKKLAKLLK
jgi:purine-nucleoside phosphorylase